MNEPVTIMVAGRSTVDLIMEIDQFSRRAEKFKATGSCFVVGGPGANASIAIARFGGHPALITFLGDDMMGKFIYQRLIDESVDLSMSVIASEAQSSVSAAFVDRKGERQTFNFPGKGFSELPNALNPNFTPSAILADNRHSELTRWAIEIGRRRNLPIVIDAEAPFIVEDVMGATHLAFSRQGLESFSPGCDIQTGLQQAQIATGCWVCVTDGENGVWFLQDKLLDKIPAFTIKAVDTVGAGDVWHGIFTLCLAEEMGEMAAIKTANAAAAMKCQKFGGIAASPDRRACSTFIEEY